MTDQYGRRYSVAETPSRSFDHRPSRRNTTAGTAAELDAARDALGHPSAANIYSRTSLETAPIVKMSKVVRSVKNVTKGYSSVQVKVRNGKQGTSTIATTGADAWNSYLQ